MCCFSQPVRHVSKTNIFARKEIKDRQFIIYSMTLDAAEDLAMILPIPYQANADRQQVRFINLEKYGQLFPDMDSGFPAQLEGSDSFGRPPAGGAKPRARILVETVGSYEASFVPTIADFDRLDERFRLPAGVWEKIPQYEKYGFVVFKLKKGSATVHPMAFSFPTALPQQLFFPTVHIHDGELHALADYDHALYCQCEATQFMNVKRWANSAALSQVFMRPELTGGIVAKDHRIYKTTIRGEDKNMDIIATPLRG